MKKITTYLWEHRLAYFFAIASMIISVSLDMLSPQLTRHIVDDVIVGGNMDLLLPLLLGILLVGVGRCIFQYTKEFTFDVTGSRIMAEMRTRLFDHIQSLSADFFDETGTGELMSRIKDDIDRIWDCFSFVGMLILEVIIASACIAITMEHKLGSIYEAISEENATLNTVAEENLAGVRTVKAFAREKFEIGKFLSHNKRYYDLNMEQSKVFIKYSPYISLITKLLPLAMLMIGGVFVMKGEISLGTLSAFLAYSMNIVWPMEMLGWLTNSLSSGIASSKKLKAIYAKTASIKDPETPVILPSVKGKVEFSNVSFHKADGYEILHDISFCVEPGRTIGIMGATGAGKSSIIHLLQRLYDVSEGAVYLDDIDIRKLSLKQLRSSVSPVMQDVFLFSDTIQENVKLGKKNELSANAVRSAIQNAQAKSFVEKMSLQYDTVIGERGVGLSGGQKQRITIARALAKKDPVLVMDDSTSALDMETEQNIHETLQSLSDTTKIIIGHRISAVCHADEIIILENGSIAERGTHQSLLARKGLYYKTYLVQYGQDTELKEKERLPHEC